MGPFRGLVDPNGIMASPNELALDRCPHQPVTVLFFLSIDSKLDTQWLFVCRCTTLPLINDFIIRYSEKEMGIQATQLVVRRDHEPLA